MSKPKSNKYKCLTNKKLDDWKIRGVGLGGMFVLEPWITPSLFYQFLNKKNPKMIGMDMYTFCEVLGPIEGKRQLNEHFSNWVNETDFINLSTRGVTHIRIPVGDWMYNPYGPYIGCTDDSLFHLDRVLKLCKKYNMQVLIDLHGVKDSQNGLDNSGMSSNIEYAVAPTNYLYDGPLTFIHWGTIAGNWIGDFDTANKSYKNINYQNIEFTKNTLYKIIEMYKDNTEVFGIEPLNEPWVYTPVDLLKDFYYDIYKYMHYNSPNLKFIYHNSFRDNIWDNFLVNCSNVAIDWHIYQAWDESRYGDQFLLEADNYVTYINNLKKKGIQTVVGEFSLATDNCAMWLNGFQDNIQGFPITDCKYSPCPYSYVKNITDLDRTKEILSPFGTGLSSPRMGTCPYEGMLVIDNNQIEFLNTLNLKKLESFSSSQGWFFWNFKTEFKDEFTWSYLESYDRKLFKGSDLQPIPVTPLWVYFVLLFSFTFILGICFAFIKRFIESLKKKKYGYVRVDLPDINETTPINRSVSDGDIKKYKYQVISV